MACGNPQWHIWKLKDDRQRRALFAVVGSLLSVALVLEVLHGQLAPQAGPVVRLHLVAEVPGPALLVDEAGEVLAQHTVPARPEKGWKKPPCNKAMEEYPINGACWQATPRKPPCGPLYEHGGMCYRPIAVMPRAPSALEP